MINGKKYCIKTFPKFGVGIFPPLYKTSRSEVTVSLNSELLLMFTVLFCKIGDLIQNICVLIYSKLHAWNCMINVLFLQHYDT